MHSPFIEIFNKVINQTQTPENKDVKTLGRHPEKFQERFWQLWEKMSCSEGIQTFK